MPPRKSARAAAVAAAPPPPSQPLNGCLIVVCGTEKGTTNAATAELVKKLGGNTHPNVIKSVTHVITTDYYYNANGAKVRPALTRSDVRIVNYDWIRECDKTNTHVDEAKYLFTASAAPAANGSAVGGSKGTKRTAPASDEECEVEDKPASKKRTKRAASKTSATQDDNEDDTKPATKGKRKDKAAPKTNGNKAAGATKTDDDNDSKPDVKPDVKKVKARVIPLDEMCPFGSYQVYVEENVAFDASLNQTNAGCNNNKFYRIQLIHNGNDYKVYTRWGRVGEPGQIATLGGPDINTAKKNFNKKFKDKSGNTWENRLAATKSGKYTFIERSYDDSDDEDDGGDADAKDDDDESEDEYEPPVSQLDPELQDLMSLIFNLKFMQAAMADLNYDANKLPLGKLAKSTITRGFQCLKDLAALFDDKALASSQYHTSYGAAVENLSNQFYSLIPHDFGRKRPPVISTEAILKKEVELLESLGDMKEAVAIMKAERSDKTKNRETIHEYDRQFKALNMREMSVVDPKSGEFKNIEEYLLGTKAPTHHMKLQLENVFRIERDGEFDRFNKSPYGSMASSDRRLLWHLLPDRTVDTRLRSGSRATNFGGILSQGLRIAPPEAPVSGYMFGKGIYLADMSTKSANYCCSYLSNKTGLLLLCEAELGNPIQKLTDASFNAGDTAKAAGMHSTWGQGKLAPPKWKDASCLHPSLKGVKMPDTNHAPDDTNVDGAYLQYNEFITYDVNQVRLRYLLRVQMT